MLYEMKKAIRPIPSWERSFLTKTSRIRSRLRNDFVFYDKKICRLEQKASTYTNQLLEGAGFRFVLSLTWSELCCTENAYKLEVSAYKNLQISSRRCQSWCQIR